MIILTAEPLLRAGGGIDNSHVDTDLNVERQEEEEQGEQEEEEEEQEREEELKSRRSSCRRNRWSLSTV